MHIQRKNPTVISSWVRPLLDKLENEGIEIDPLLEEAGIDKRMLMDPDARIRVEKMNSLWKQAVKITNNNSLGLEAAAYVRPTTPHALGFAMMVSDSLIDAFKRLSRFYRIVSDTIKLELDYLDDLFVVSLNANEIAPHPANEALDMAMASIILFARTLLQIELNPDKVEFRREKPDNLTVYQQIFQSPVVFGAKTNRFFFRQQDIKCKLPSANTEIARCNDEIVIDYIAKFDKDNILNQVYAKIIKLLPLGEPSFDKLASALNISVRSLHRSLNKENITYRAILDEIRKYLAIQYLKKPQYSIIEIAFQIGYSDSANFTRAFKRWFKISPSKYREQSQNERSV